MRAALRSAFLASAFPLALASSGCGVSPSVPRNSSLAAEAPSGVYEVVQEPARGGLGRSFELVDARWGRRVDLWVRDAAGREARPVFAGLVVGPDLSRLREDLVVARSLATGRDRLTVLHPRDSAGFTRVLQTLEAGRVPLRDSTLPADAALELRFSDLIDADTLDGGRVALLAASGGQVSRPAELDLAHGVQLDGAHRSARLVIELDPARVTLGAEIELHLQALANRAGRRLADATLAPLSARVATGTRSALDGGSAPFVVGRLPGSVTTVVGSSNPGYFLIDFRFDQLACAFAPQPGDVIETPGHALQVLSPGKPPVAGSSGRLRVLLVRGEAATLVPAAGELRARWDPSLGAPAECFVRITPAPTVGVAAGVSTDAVVEVGFSEPMQVGSVQSTGSLRLAYGQPSSSSPLAQYVAASVVPAAAATRFVLAPSLPLRHQQGQAETYRMRLTGGPGGVVDASGMPLEIELPQLSLQLDPTQPSRGTDSLTLTFNAPDEDGDSLADLRGQGLYDLAQGTLAARSVARFSAVIDPSQPLLNVMVTTGSGIQTPIVPLGSRQMSAWRYGDMGFNLLDDEHHNLDVEGLNWAPFGGVIADAISQFRMAFAHSFFLPDEVVSVSLLPLYKNSGLVANFEANLLSPDLDPLRVVHPKSKGYVISPADSFVSQTGTLMHPWPLNRDVLPDQFAYWTWRDTAKTSIGGPATGVGADPLRMEQILGTCCTLTGFYPALNIPTIGEPLLTEFRCYPDPGGLGLNSLRTSFAINSSAKPTFRAYSSGGVDAQGQVRLVDPDNEPVAQGGFNPLTGQPTPPIDNTVLWGQADFVVRVSRAHTRWFDTGAAHDFGPTVVEAGPLGLPPGTAAKVAFRGASQVSAVSGQPWLDSAGYDPYGEAYTQLQLDMLYAPGSKLTFDVTAYPLTGEHFWRESIDELDGARFVQMRISFVSNAVTGSAPVLAGIALAFEP